MEQVIHLSTTRRRRRRLHLRGVHRSRDPRLGSFTGDRRRRDHRPRLRRHHRRTDDTDACGPEGERPVRRRRLAAGRSRRADPSAGRCSAASSRDATASRHLLLRLLVDASHDTRGGRERMDRVGEHRRAARRASSPAPPRGSARRLPDTPRTLRPAVPLSIHDRREVAAGTLDRLPLARAREVARDLERVDPLLLRLVDGEPDEAASGSVNVTFGTTRRSAFAGRPDGRSRGDDRPRSRRRA